MYRQIARAERDSEHDAADEPSYVSVVVYSRCHEAVQQIDSGEHQQTNQGASSHIAQLVAMSQEERHQPAQHSEHRPARSHAYRVGDQAQAQCVARNATSKTGQHVYDCKSAAPV